MTNHTPALLHGRHITCKRCLSPMVFAITDAGKPMPLDVYVDDTGTGNVAVMRDHTGRLRARVLKDGEQPYGYERRAMPHFATCQPQRTPDQLPDGVASFEQHRARRSSR